MAALKDAKNLGSLTASELESCGVDSLQVLQKWGLEEVFLVLIEKFPERLNLNCLLALYGAIHNLDWREIPQGKKQVLVGFLEKTKAQKNKGLL